MATGQTSQLKGARRWFIATAVLLVIVGVAFATLIRVTSRPSLQAKGVPFRLWLASDSVRNQALDQVGTNVIPDLIAILSRSPQSDIQYKRQAKAWSLLPRFVRGRLADWEPLPDSQLRRGALAALRYLGPDASCALPVVGKIARTETNGQVLAQALLAAISIAPKAPEAAELWCDEWVHTNHFSRPSLAQYLCISETPIPRILPYLLAEAGTSEAYVFEALSMYGEGASPALPLMIKSFSENTANRPRLLRVFEHLGPIASNAVPALVACLGERGPATSTAFNAMTGTRVQNDDRPRLIAGSLRALQAMGPAAKPALPAIRPLLTNENAGIAMLAAAAQVRVGGSVEEAMPILLTGLRNGDGWGDVSLTIQEEGGQPVGGTGGRDAAIVLCGELGPAASAALPDIQAYLTNANTEFRLNAARAVWRISGNAEKSLPVLISIIDSAQERNQSGAIDFWTSSAIEGIAEMGPKGQPAAPSLERVRTLSIPLRRAADRALARIRAGVQGASEDPR